MPDASPNPARGAQPGRFQRPRPRLGLDALPSHLIDDDEDILDEGREVELDPPDEDKSAPRLPRRERRVVFERVRLDSYETEFWHDLDGNLYADKALTQPVGLTIVALAAVLEDEVPAP